MSLREEIKDIGERIAAHFDSGGDPPFIIYQYAPGEWDACADLGCPGCDREPF